MYDKQTPKSVTYQSRREKKYKCFKLKPDVNRSLVTDKNLKTPPDFVLNMPNLYKRNGYPFHAKRDFHPKT